MVNPLALELGKPVDGVALYIWHNRQPCYNVVHWIPGRSLTRGAARLLALRTLLEDPKASRVQVVYREQEFEQSVRSQPGIVRLCTENEKAGHLPGSD